MARPLHTSDNAAPEQRRTRRVYGSIPPATANESNNAKQPLHVLETGNRCFHGQVDVDHLTVQDYVRNHIKH